MSTTAGSRPRMILRATLHGSQHSTPWPRLPRALLETARHSRGALQCAYVDWVHARQSDAP
eukprot:1001602-Pyramimonas_sp.AAC.1